jgi:DNA gyrase/topoisomerase IV subunit A
MKESIQQMAASLRHSATNIQEYSSGIEIMSSTIIELSSSEITMNDADKIIMGLNVCSKYMATLETFIKSAKRTAELINDEVYEMPEALKRNEL